MTLTRQDRLQALGLWPAWRLRGSKPTEIAAVGRKSEAPSAECAGDVAEGDSLEQSRRDPEQPVGRTSAASSAECANVMAEGAALVRPTPEPDPHPANAIRAMDWTALTAAIQSCTRCDLSKSRTQAVPGIGDIHAEWLFVGEAPGANEDRLGEPFVGDAGKLLDAMLAAIGLARDRNVFIANVLKSRPPGNRDPLPNEVVTCLPYLERQIELIQPKLIVALGRFAAQNLLATDTPIGKLRGAVHRYRGVPLIVTYHPAYLLRNSLDKAKVWEDLVLARDTMIQLKN